MDNLKRRENETLFEWKLRLSLMKLNKETDLDWSELVDILEMDMSADHYVDRKSFLKEVLNKVEEIESRK